MDITAADMVEVLTCNVCNKNEAMGIFASTCGAVSFAYCKECLESGREPYGALVAYLMGIPDMDCVADWIKPTIKATLHAEGKTEDQFFQDIRKMGEGVA